MPELPPPPNGPLASPPAGWYADPSGDGLRWWDGAQWTDAVTTGAEDESSPVGADAPAFPPVPPPPASTVAEPALMSVGDWIGRSFRLTIGSLGAYMPLILLVVIPWFLALAVSTWYGLRDGVMVADFETGDIAFENLEGRLPLLSLSIAMLFMLFLGLRLLYVYASRNVSARYATADAMDGNTNADQAVEDPNTIGSAARQWPSVVGVTLVRVAVYVVLYLAGWLAVLLSPVMILAAPIIVAVMVWFWTRHVLSNAPASDGDGWRASLDRARAATAERAVGVFGRLVSLTVVGFSLVIVANTFGSVAASISGSQPDTPVEPFAETVLFNDLFPSNPAALALSWVFLAIGVGAWQILSATAHTLLYLDLRGELDLSSEAAEAGQGS